MTSTPPYRDKIRQTYSNSPVTAGGSTSAQNPFTAGQNAHPNFTPVKLGTKGAETRIPKPPKQPEKPLMPYMRYSRKVWDQVKAQHQDLKLWQLGKVIGQMWRDLSEIEKQEFVDDYEAEKLQYNENMRQYHNSPAYQSFLKEKQKAEAMIEEEERNRARMSKNEPRVTIQPADDEEDSSEMFSVKHVAAARYHRNHRLIAEIFNDIVVPDLRSIVTANRLAMLRKQVQSLTAHQAKLESELVEMEDKFQAKKRKIVEANEEFERSWNELCEKRPRFTDEQLEQLVTKTKDELQQQFRQKAAAAAVLATEHGKPDADKGGSGSLAEVVDGVRAAAAAQAPAAATTSAAEIGPQMAAAAAAACSAVSELQQPLSQQQQLLPGKADAGSQDPVAVVSAGSFGGAREGGSSVGTPALSSAAEMPEESSHNGGVDATSVGRQASSGSEHTQASKEEDNDEEALDGEAKEDSSGPEGNGSDDDYQLSAMEDETNDDGM